MTDIHFTIEQDGQEFSFELVHTSDCIALTGKKGWFWACAKPDEESKTFATKGECILHAFQWVSDNLLAEVIENEELKQDRRYGTYESQNRLSGRQLGAL